MDHGEWFLENHGSRKLFIFSWISSVCDDEIFLLMAESLSSVSAKVALGLMEFSVWSYVAKPNAKELWNLNTKLLVFCNKSEYGYHKEPVRIQIKNEYTRGDVFECALLLFCFVFSMLLLLFVLFLGDVGVFLASYTRPHARRLSLFFCLNLWVG